MRKIISLIGGFLVLALLCLTTCSPASSVSVKFPPELQGTWYSVDGCHDVYTGYSMTIKDDTIMPGDYYLKSIDVSKGHFMTTTTQGSWIYESTTGRLRMSKYTKGTNPCPSCPGNIDSEGYVTVSYLYLCCDYWVH